MGLVRSFLVGCHQCVLVSDFGTYFGSVKTFGGTANLLGFYVHPKNVQTISLECCV